jgi:hypothetical protein
MERLNFSSTHPRRGNHGNRNQFHKYCQNPVLDQYRQLFHNHYQLKRRLTWTPLHYKCCLSTGLSAERKSNRMSIADLAAILYSDLRVAFFLLVLLYSARFALPCLMYAPAAGPFCTLLGKCPRHSPAAGASLGVRPHRLRGTALPNATPTSLVNGFLYPLRLKSHFGQRFKVPFFSGLIG